MSPQEGGMLRIYKLTALTIITLFAGGVFANEPSSCIKHENKIECYSDFIGNHNGEESATLALNKIIEKIEATTEEGLRLLLTDQVLNKIGKNYLPYFPPYLRFYFSGPNHLEIYYLIKMKNSGVSDKDMINIILNAKGSYSPIGPQGVAVLKNEKFSALLINILTNYSFLKSGDKININSLRMLIDSNAAEKEKLEIIALSNIKDTKINEERKKLLQDLGFSNEHIKTLKYNQLLRDGPSDYTLWEIIQDHQKGLPDTSIIKKISAAGFFYKNYNENEVEVIQTFGVRPTVIQSMQEQSKKFFSDVTQTPKNNDIREKTYHVIQDKTAAHIQSYQQKSDLFKGVNTEKQKIEGNGLLDAAKDCLALKAALKACEHVPFPLGYGCTALARNKFNCMIPM